MKSILPFIIPQKIAEFHTPYNSYIRVNDEGKENKLLVNGSPQSGAYIRTLWKSAFSAFEISTRSIHRILILGVGGGTAIKELHTLFPQAMMTGVEIDPKMIEIGKIFFSLNDVSYLHIVQADARDFMDVSAHKHVRYDMIVVDVFSGRVIPSFVLASDFLNHIRVSLTKNGCVVINYLRELEYEKLSDVLKKRLSHEFPIIMDHGIYRNRFFFGSIV